MVTLPSSCPWVHQSCRALEAVHPPELLLPCIRPQPENWAGFYPEAGSMPTKLSVLLCRSCLQVVLGVPGIIQKSNCLSIQLQSLFLGLDMDQRAGRGNGHLDKSTVCLLSHPALPGMSSCTLKAFSMQFLLRYASITCPTPRRASLVA